MLEAPLSGHSSFAFIYVSCLPGFVVGRRIARTLVIENFVTLRLMMGEAFFFWQERLRLTLYSDAFLVIYWGAPTI